MDNRRIPLLSHLKTSLAKAMALIAELANSVSDTFESLHDVAYSGKYSDLSDAPTVLTGGSQTITSSTDGGSNVFTFTKSDGTKSTLTVKNGSKGSKGDTGPTGPQGEKGSDATVSLTDAEIAAIYSELYSS